MDKIYVTLEIGPHNNKVTPVCFLVDTESLYTFISPELTNWLELEISAKSSLQLSDGSRVDLPVGFAYIRIEDRDGGTLVSAMDVAEPRLGSAALQALGLEVNPEKKAVEFTGLYPTKV